MESTTRSTEETPTPYERMADAYQALAGEPLVADEEWSLPYYEAALVAAELSGDSDLDDPTGYELEAARRAAAAILVLTYGAEALAHQLRRGR